MSVDVKHCGHVGRPVIGSVCPVLWYVSGHKTWRSACRRNGASIVTPSDLTTRLPFRWPDVAEGMAARCGERGFKSGGHSIRRFIPSSRQLGNDCGDITICRCARTRRGVGCRASAVLGEEGKQVLLIWVVGALCLWWLNHTRAVGIRHPTKMVQTLEGWGACEKWCRCRCSSLCFARNDDGLQDGGFGRICNRGWRSVVVARAQLGASWSSTCAHPRRK